MSTSELGSLELTIVTYNDGFLKTAEIREGTGSLYQKLAAVVWLSADDLKLLGVAEGKLLEMKNAAGSIIVRVEANPNGKSGIGYMPFSLYSLYLTSYDPNKSKFPSFKRIEVTATRSDQDVTPISALQGVKLA